MQVSLMHCAVEQLSVETTLIFFLFTHLPCNRGKHLKTDVSRIQNGTELHASSCETNTLRA